MNLRETYYSWSNTSAYSTAKPGSVATGMGSGSVYFSGYLVAAGLS